MSTYVPNYKNDIFISYSHVDNEPFPGADKGWVTTFVNGLKTELGRQLGRSNAYSLWMDYELRGNQPVTADIDNQLNSCATLVLIFSRGYLASSWCLLELNTFLAQVGNGSGRIFMVEHDFVPFEERPPEFQDLLGYPFWMKNPDTGRIRTLAIPKPNPDREPEYYQTLNELARDLTTTLNKLKNEANKPNEDDNNVSGLAAMKKKRLESEKLRIEGELKSKNTDYESVLTSVSNPRIPQTTKTNLNNRLDQLEAEIGTLEAELEHIKNELKKY